MTTQQKTARGGRLFLTLTIIAYLAAAAYDVNLAGRALANLSELLARIVPILLLVFVLMYCFNLFVRTEALSRRLGNRGGIAGWLTAIGGGIASMGAAYLWYPLLADLRKKGVSDKFMVTFLYNRAVKVPLIPLMIHYFGVTLTILITAYMVIFSVINGVVVNTFLHRKR